ncbi:MAG TPA: AI-2E family transporter [Arachnia sp.]|nr:AI-2E family transporter [Arachnia sp.]HMT86937.1 AI-2E family transporter [Arachnia sp.]
MSQDDVDPNDIPQPPLTPGAPATAVALEALPQPDPDHPVDKSDVIGEAGRWLAAWSGRFLLIAAAAVVAGYGLSKVSGAAIPVMLGLIISSVLWPLVRKLKSWGVSFGIGALLSLLLGVGVIVGLFSLIAPAVASQWDYLSSSAIAGIRRIQLWIAEPPWNINDDQVNLWVSQFVQWLQGRSADIAQTLLSVGGSVGSVLATTVISLMITFFMLKDGSKFVPWTKNIVGHRVGFHAAELFTRIWNTIAGYIRTQALVSFVDALFIGIGLWALSVPLAFPLAVLTFMAGFIPIVGAVTAGALAVLVALVSNGPWIALAVLGVVLLVQQIESNVLQPFLQSKVMELHPVIVLLAVLLGGTWAGILGAFLAVPVAATIAVVFRYFGDLANLRTGEVKAEEIVWATEDGVILGGRQEEESVNFKNRMRLRTFDLDALRNPFKRSQPTPPRDADGD